jgi:hypothetical protein
MKAIIIALFTIAAFCVLVHVVFWPVLTRPDTQEMQGRIERALRDWASGDNGR